MDLDRFAAAVRPRTPWEAVDLGWALVRAWWRPMLGAWLSTTLPVWAAVFLLQPRRPLVALLVVWWLAPLFDRVPLFVASRALFGGTPRLRELVRALPRLWGTRIVAALTYGRFDPARSFDQPVTLLEGLSGRARRERIRLLQADRRGTAVLLSFAAAVLALLATVALVGLVGLLLPQTIEGRWWRALGDALGGSGPPWAGPLLGALAWLGWSLVEPCYAVAGFTLYLDRRIRLEGWDIEIAFRRLAARLRAAAPSAAAAAVTGTIVVCLLVAAPLLAPTPAAAATGAEPATAATESRPSSSAAAKRDPQQAIERVLARPELQTRVRQRVWHTRWHPDRRRADAPAWMLGLGGVTGRLLEAALWVALAGFLLTLARTLMRRVRGPGTVATHRGLPPLPPTVAGLDVRPESLPADVAGAAWQRWQAGDGAAALALLYRGALARLIGSGRLPAHASWTEEECLACFGRSEPATSAALGYLRRLTTAWQATAYAHRRPDDATAHALCDEWPSHFAVAP